MMVRDQHLPLGARQVSHALFASASRIEDERDAEMSLLRVFETEPDSQVVATTFSSGSPRTKRSMFRATSRERRSMVPSVRGEQWGVMITFGRREGGGVGSSALG